MATKVLMVELLCSVEPSPWRTDDDCASSDLDDRGSSTSPGEVPTTDRMPVRLSLLVALITLTLVAPARAEDFAWPVAYTSQAKNPADALAELPIEAPAYDPATHCSKKPRPGMTALVDWLGAHAGGAFWGTYRCEKWGPHSASLHAEGRAVDWALDVDVP